MAGFDHFAEFGEGLGKSVIVVELRRAMQLDGCLGLHGRCTASQPKSEQTRCKKMLHVRFLSDGPLAGSDTILQGRGALFNLLSISTVRNRANTRNKSRVSN